MSTETRWVVHTLPSTPVDDLLDLAGIALTLVVATDAPEVVQAIEDAARRNGMVIERLPYTPSVSPPVYPDKP